MVVDDEYQKISHVVRGGDLLSSTPRQIYLQQLLDFKTPRYAHIPIAVNDQDVKLSKQNFSPGIEMRIVIFTFSGSSISWAETTRHLSRASSRATGNGQYVIGIYMLYPS